MTIEVAPRNEDFEIGIICSQPLEEFAIRGIFDQIYPENDNNKRAPSDTNTYTKGIIGQHAVVLTQIFRRGKVSAAGVASKFRASFERLKLVLLVGTCGGMPTGANNEEIFLGDVVIAKNLIQSDFGRLYPDGFHRKDDVESSLGRQGPEIRSFVAKLESTRMDLKAKMSECLDCLLENPAFEKARYPGVHEDKLFQSSYMHKHHDGSDCECVEENKICHVAKHSACEEIGCKTDYLVPRKRHRIRQDQRPGIHFGTIASGDAAIESGHHRDKIAQKENAIAFEMAGAGVWDYLPCVIIKGVCDYADGHRNRRWEYYAAVTALACAKAVLEQWSPRWKSQSEQYQVKNRWENSNGVKILYQADKVTNMGTQNFNM